MTPERKQQLADPNISYEVDCVKHVYCAVCLPDFQWIREMQAANRLTNMKRTGEPCEACGSKD